ncbi:23S rRNA (guanosine(2251)-2'-O)-methyltransferase RlmB [Allobranchiibius huperziae]|uniref:23S rRNA (Guanosine2251-2'-O)-methyltransferase n=1 Tax=Allobranchiibius huperziae TaxID=1874116 RepID=A0A853DMB9_9MICO|nr:23S rRNA (guanosine(2251)-2'-O)-methyltransferase RlmB [Allobranchiibius huperziae]NYJ75891.1 23S rRNA (guanosine2251-2'-O)-methyltransferase [Allobranchiibius huperziae]
MAGNSQRRGAIRKGASRKGASVGSGGQRRRGLEGKGPTPKATERPNHKAYSKSSSSGGSGGSSSRGPSRGRSGSKKPSSEIVAGRNSVLDALRAEIPATAMYVAGRIESDDRVRSALKLAADRAIPILETPRGELDRITDGAVHQGLALQVPPYDYAHPNDFFDPEAPGIPLVVALDGITDPRNLGAILRSVGAFGGHGVIVPERRSVGMTASAWKTSAGAAARVPVALAGNLNRTLEDFRKAGFFVLGLDMDGEVELPDVQLATEPLVVVVGSEGKGLSRLVRENCDQIVSVPMSASTESLNAGIAASVALYEIARKRATRS